MDVMRVWDGDKERGTALDGQAGSAEDAYPGRRRGEERLSSDNFLPIAKRTDGGREVRSGLLLSISYRFFWESAYQGQARTEDAPVHNGTERVLSRTATLHHRTQAGRLHPVEEYLSLLFLLLRNGKRNPTSPTATPCITHSDSDPRVPPLF